MVYGIEKFKEYFNDYTGQYVFIGGTACSILLDELGMDFRATKDLDMVLLIEELDESFGETFWSFIEDGGYIHRQKSTGYEQFYRFSNPQKHGFPKMIELFSRKPDGMILNLASALTPIPLGESIASLSAILLNDDYYQLLLDGKSVINGYSVLAIEYVLLFKIRAWLDLSERKEQGDYIDSRDVKKHKNDIFRLLMFISPEKRIDVNKEIITDVELFIEKISDEKIDLKNIGIRSISLEELLERVRILYKRNEP